MAVLPGGAINTTDTVRSVPEGTPLPPGIYTGIVTKTAQKPTNDGTGVFVEVEFDITSPQEHASRKFWDRFNIVNASTVATEIGKEAIADLGLACGFPILEDDEQLQGREVILELYIEPAKPYIDKRTNQQREGKPQNKCRKYWPVGTDVEAAKKAQKAAKGATTPVAAAAPATGGTSRWATAAKPAAAPSTVAAPQAVVPQANVAPQPAAPAMVAPVVTPAQAPVASATSQAPWKRNKQ